MSSDVESHVLQRIAAAPICREPFAHCVIDGVFPADFYEAILEHWPEEASWRPLSGRVEKTYAERFVVLMTDPDYARLDQRRRIFWKEEVDVWMMGDRFRTALLQKFGAELRGTPFDAQPAHTAGDGLIVSDRTNYEIGPHTDAPHRVVSLLFYLPEDATFRRFGTSFYAPNDPAVRCAGGPHYEFAAFHRCATVEFLPNRLVMFPKSDRCFHGVERVDLTGIERRLLIYNVRRTR